MHSVITLTEKAIEKVKLFAGKEPSAHGKFLRIFVKTGNCSGFEFGFSFDHQNDGDSVVNSGELQILIDQLSLKYLDNATVDYVDDARGAGFVVQNPNMKNSCGCGNSFS